MSIGNAIRPILNFLSGSSNEVTRNTGKSIKGTAESANQSNDLKSINRIEMLENKPAEVKKATTPGVQTALNNAVANSCGIGQMQTGSH